MKPAHGQRGFTLTEIAIALIVLSLLTVFVMDQVGPLVQRPRASAPAGSIVPAARTRRACSSLSIDAALSR